MIDLHSDTVTKPTLRMREAMSCARVGDDVSEEDPTVNLLQDRVASLFGKESALFFPSGTMDNLTAVLAWSPNRGSEIIVGDKSHMFLFEQGGVSQFGGVSIRTVKNRSDGTMAISEIIEAIRDDDIHEPITTLICIENTHNACGGKVLPISFLEELRKMSATPIHMDGARLWNALTASQEQPKDIAKYVNSLTVCLSKGLGCPIGSLLVGSSDLIKRARRIRKGLGGGMRQVGVLAAAGLVGIDYFEKGGLKNDHLRMSRLAQSISHLPAFRALSAVETNILFLEVMLGTAQEVCDKMRDNGIIVSAWSSKLVRIVVHRDINDAMIDQTIRALVDVSDELTNTTNYK